MKRFLLLFALAIQPTWLLAQGTFLYIGFEGPPAINRGSEIGVTQYAEQGIVFYPLGFGNQFGRHGGGVSTSPENGSAYVRTAFGESLGFRYFDSRVFGLFSVDLAEYSIVFPEPITISFIGYRSDGTTVTTSFTTDGIIDGTGPLADFQTFHFPSNFANIYRVEVPTFPWSLDNLVVAVPEPGTSALLVIGTLIFTIRRMTRKK